MPVKTTHIPRNNGTALNLDSKSKSPRLHTINRQGDQKKHKIEESTTWLNSLVLGKKINFKSVKYGVV
jgi:hypothetical protein